MSENQRGQEYGVIHAKTKTLGTLVEVVETILHESELAINAKDLIQLGSVYVNDSRNQNLSATVAQGSPVRVHSRPRRFDRPRDLTKRILSETDDALVVDKPPGLPVHPLVDNSKENLLSFLEDLRNEKLYVTHRLDVDTSGVVLFAKTPEAQARFNLRFANGSLKRSYVAYVSSTVQTGAYRHFMEPSPKAPKKVSHTANPGWVECRLTVLKSEQIESSKGVLKEGSSLWLLKSPASSITRLEIELQTGRPQQIRAQLASLGAPILGDANYGSEVEVLDQTTNAKAIALRASELRF